MPPAHAQEKAKIHGKSRHCAPVGRARIPTQRGPSDGPQVGRPELAQVDSARVPEIGSPLGQKIGDSPGAQGAP